MRHSVMREINAHEVFESLRAGNQIYMISPKDKPDVLDMNTWNVNKMALATYLARMKHERQVMLLEISWQEE